MSEADLRLQLVEWKATESEYPRGACVHELVSAQAVHTPESVAVVCGDDRLTYAELERRANQIAHRLRAAGASTGTIVGIGVDRSLDMVAGLLGILKSGAAYVPLDPRHPPDRLSFMLEDSGAAVLLTQRHLLEGLARLRTVPVCIDDPLVDELSDTPPPHSTSPEDLAYILYTSGSTGRPKGVRVRHRNVVNLMSALAKKPGISPDDVVLAVATYIFDMSVGDIFPTLGTGARVVLASRHDVRDRRRLSTLIDNAGATIMHATPATWQMLVDAGWEGRTGLVAVSGGDALSEVLATALLDRCAAVWNGYGPTETTVYATFSRVRRGAPISIGRPIANVRAYILDRQQQPVPVGVSGELAISGAGVAGGYVNRPEETAQHFVPDPFVNGEQMHLTGDLARFLPDGSIVHMGRLDRQVKVRGVRIEPGEIEAALVTHPAISSAVVAVREDARGDRCLVAYITPDRGSPRASELKEFLRRSLPEYMMPSAFVALDNLPLTPTGKVDRRALPAPDAGQESTTAFAAPHSALEERVAGIWAATLGMDRVGVNDDFFELGGHSLLAVRLLVSVEREFGAEVPLTALFEQGSTIAGMATVIESILDGGEVNPVIVPVQSRGSAPALFFVHPDELTMLTLRHFIGPLGPDQRVVGLLPERLGRQFDQSRTIEDLAEPMLEAIRGIQPHGPYCLAGFSLGALFAYEIAGRLEESAEPVAWLGILDCPTPEAGRRIYWLRSPRGFLARLLERGPRRAARKAARIAWHRVKAPLVRLQMLPAPVTDDFDYRGAMELETKYACRGNRVPMELFVDVDMVDMTRSPSLGWETVHRGPITVHPIPGDHLSMLAEPNVRVVADILTASLRRAQVSGAAPSS